MCLRIKKMCLRIKKNNQKWYVTLSNKLDKSQKLLSKRNKKL